MFESRTYRVKTTFFSNFSPERFNTCLAGGSTFFFLVYEKAGIKISPRALEREVANIVQDTVPNYAKVGEFVRGMRVSPFGNFM